VVSKSGTVTGVVGGTTGGFIMGSASGDTLNYSSTVNGQSTSGTATVAPGGQLSGTSDGCVERVEKWGCGLDSINVCVCRYYGPDSKGAPCPATHQYCYLRPGPSSLTTECDCWTTSVNGGGPSVPQCNTVAWDAGAPPTQLVCNQAWQASPAPCTAISYSGGTGPIHTGVAIPCPGPFANLSGTCAGGNTAACTPPPGGCACPAAGGCNTCGTISACCLP
jgi:hypothetical protein